MSDCDNTTKRNYTGDKLDFLVSGGGFKDGWRIELWDAHGEKLEHSYTTEVAEDDKTYIKVKLAEPVPINTIGYNISNDNWISDLNTDKDSETGFFSTNRCKHDTFTYRKVRVNLWLFELVMLYRVCHDCHELIKDYKKWKLRWI